MISRTDIAIAVLLFAHCELLTVPVTVVAALTVFKSIISLADYRLCINDVRLSGLTVLFIESDSTNIGHCRADNVCLIQTGPERSSFDIMR